MVLFSTRAYNLGSNVFGPVTGTRPGFHLVWSRFKLNQKVADCSHNFMPLLSFSFCMSVSCQVSCHCFPCSHLGNTIEDSVGLIVYIVFFCTLKANQYKLSFKVSNYWISPCQNLKHMGARAIQACSQVLKGNQEKWL